MGVGLKDEFTLRMVERISDIDPQQWDACANPASFSGADCLPYDPFVAYAFLSALEESQSAVPETGWAPRHLILESKNGELLGVVPMYIKSHSRGEYVFDYQWADAFEQAGGMYYPKLQASVPFTPVTGRRLLVRPGEHEKAAESILIEGCMQAAKQLAVSSLHFTFLKTEQADHLEEFGFLCRTDQQFHWQNVGYTDFDDFLGALSSKKRRNIQRERRIALENSIRIELLIGTEITESHWDAFFRFYMDTGSRKWGTPYLKRPFFSMVGASMADRILLVMCRLGDDYVAGALNFIGGDCLYGRYWGTLGDFPCLHFEVCYYQAIEYAIRHKLSFVEAGAQGEHKLARGYLPHQTDSAHWIANDRFRSAIASYLVSERRSVDENIQVWHTHSPFRSEKN
jgi:predicted N-acyltransferase